VAVFDGRGVKTLDRSHHAAAVGVTVLPGRVHRSSARQAHLHPDPHAPDVSRSETPHAARCPRFLMGPTAPAHSTRVGLAMPDTPTAHPAICQESMRLTPIDCAAPVDAGLSSWQGSGLALMVSFIGIVAGDGNGCPGRMEAHHRSMSG